MEELAEQTHALSVSLLAQRRDVILAIVDGQLEAGCRAAAAIRRAFRRVRRVDSRETIHALDAACSALYLGRAEAWLAAYDEFVELAGVASQAVDFVVPSRAVCLAELGRGEEAL